MRLAAAALVAIVAAGGCTRPARPGPALAAEACAPGVTARTRATSLAFSNGWTRLRLAPCPEADAARRLQVDGAERVLAFAPGRPGGATAAVLTATATAAPAPTQAFDLPAGSARAREVVLAPWPFAGRPPRLRRVSLLSGGRR